MVRKGKGEWEAWWTASHNKVQNLTCHLSINFRKESNGKENMALSKRGIGNTGKE
jgi:hypothetical protein